MEETITPVKQRRPRREANPLLVKELRGRMRGARAFVVLTVHLLLMSCFAAVVYAAVDSTSSYSRPDTSAMGKAVFTTVVIVQIFMVTFITPAFTAGTITGERERKTYELLRTTLLPAGRVVLGKLSSALTYMLLLILAAVPLEALAFMLGGVTVGELILAQVILLAAAFFFGALGIFLSSIARTTLAATVLGYVIALLGTVGLPIVLLLFDTVAIVPLYTFTPSSVVPIALQIIVYVLLYTALNLSPLGAAVITEMILLEENSAWLFWIDLSSTQRMPVPSGWIAYTLLSVGVGLIMLWIATRRVKRQETR